MMKKILFFGVSACMLISTTYAGNGDQPKSVRVQKAVRHVSNVEKRTNASNAEAKASTATAVVPFKPMVAKRSGGTNSTQATNIFYSDLGQSFNPFTIITAGRNCLSVVPELNAVAFFRRGGPTNPAGSTNLPGNKLYYDLNTKGGVDGQWQKSKGPIFSDDLFVNSPGYLLPDINYGPRYPQGALVNVTPGNTDTSNVVAFGTAAVLDGTNGTWGGFGTGWRKLAANAVTTTHNFSSPDPLHYISESMEVTSTGAIFAVNAERDASGAATAFTDKITIYKYLYNSVTGTFDSTISYVPFSNEGGDYATFVASTQIAFGQDGLTGYLAVGAANNEFDSTATILPYIAKTTDGGATWSNLKLIPLNKRWNEQASPEKDGLRDQLFVGNRVRFTEAGTIDATTYDDPTGHFVDYFVNDIDLTVDKNNYAHIFTNVCVSGFGDTLNQLFPDVRYYPGYGSWNIDLYINHMDSSARGILLSRNFAVNGCWGDCSGTTNSFTEANRPAISRSTDGAVVAFAWYDTDTTEHPQLTDDRNGNPDLWMRTLRTTDPGKFFLDASPRNLTAGGEYAGAAILGNVAPKLLNTANGYGLASTLSILGEFTGTTSPWPTQHVYVGGVEISASADSFPVAIEKGAIILKTDQSIASAFSKTKNMDMKVMPNPSKGQATIHLNVSKSGNAEIKMINSIGQVVEEKSILLPKGEINVPFQFKNAKPGVYMIQVKMDNQIGTQRIVKD